MKSGCGHEKSKLRENFEKNCLIVMHYSNQNISTERLHTSLCMNTWDNLLLIEMEFHGEEEKNMLSEWGSFYLKGGASNLQLD